MLFTAFHQRKIIYRQFHTSSPRYVHPLIWVFLKPTLKGVAWITGRSTRKWYRQLPPEKRSVFIQHLNRHKYKYLGIFGTIGTAIAIHYYTHLETVPITGRRRYMIMNMETLESFLDMAKENHAKDHYSKVFPEDSEQTRLVARVAKRIIASNMDIPSIKTIKWCVRVVDIDTKNAFVLPSGDIYVFRGMLETVTNEDQLAAILGHEMSHAILGHTLEEMSYTRIMDMIAIFGAFIIWTVFPSDWTSFCVNYIFDKFIKLAARLPYSRRLEEEADGVGLMLAAKACYDVRESVNYWQTAHKTRDQSEHSEYRSTHPSHINRAEYLNEILPWALNIRSQCNCFPLSHNQSLRALNLPNNQTKK